MFDAKHRKRLVICCAMPFIVCILFVLILWLIRSLPDAPFMQWAELDAKIMTLIHVPEDTGLHSHDEYWKAHLDLYDKKEKYVASDCSKVPKRIWDTMKVGDVHRAEVRTSFWGKFYLNKSKYEWGKAGQWW